MTNKKIQKGGEPPLAITNGTIQSNQNENVFGNIKSYYALTKVINEKITK